MKTLFVRFACLVLLATGAFGATPMDKQFEALAARYLDEFTALSPVSATSLGDHRFDAELDQVDAAARAKDLAFARRYLEALTAIDASALSRANQVDRALLRHRLEAQVWHMEELREWEWNPLIYVNSAGGAIYGLMAREFAPVETRLNAAAARLEALPRLYAQSREALVPALVPKVHAETAVKQNRGVLSILDNLVRPHLDALSAGDRTRLEAAMATATAAVEEHQKWLEESLLPNAAGDFRLGAERFDKKLGFALETGLSRRDVRKRAESELHKTREEMYELAKVVYAEAYPYTEFPSRPDAAYRQALIRAALELAYRDTPAPDAVVATARESLAMTTAFVREHDLVTIPPDPLDIIIMPEFQRGVSLAYCDSPGPLDVGQKTFYAVAPMPEDWTAKQVQSFLREYNVRSIHDLTVHEAMPGHFLQLAHANRYPGTLRSVLGSGTFIEGWAVYAERMMCDEGLLDNDPLMKLINLKWYLRSITNALMDQAIHVDGMTKEEAMKLMIESGFQEEREADAKWTRAQLTSAQLSTYFVGFQEHRDLRDEVERAWGGDFTLKKYHDTVLSFGSPPVQYVKALVLEAPLPE